MNFKPGDKVKIIGNDNYHYFPIYRYVKICYVKDSSIDRVYYLCEDENGDKSFVLHKNLEPAYIKEFNDKLEGILNES